MSDPDSDLDGERRQETQRWLAVAEADLRTARLCLDATEPLLGIAAYHCQQAAEKVLKGMLVMADVPFTKTHDLVLLGNLAASYHADLRLTLSDIGRMTVWGYAYRYPTLEDSPEPEPSSDVIIADIAMIDRMAEHLRSLLAPTN